MSTEMKLERTLHLKQNHFKWFCFLFTSLLFLSQCGTNSNPNTYENKDDLDLSDWIEVKSGNMPLVISAPHGGTLTPNEIPDRTCPDITTVTDSNTDDLAFELQHQINEQFGMEPYIVVALISRKKIDLNRNIQEASCGNSITKKIWNTYHDYVEKAIAKAVKEHGGVIFIDLHGHGHDNQRLELGYLLSKEELRESFNGSDQTGELGEKSSLGNLLSGTNDVNLQDLLTGEHAFGTIMEDEGVASVPSLQDPFPYQDQAYFTGGYNTSRYTSEDYPEVFGWQIEANFDGVRDSDESRSEFSKAFSKAIMVQLEEYIF